MDPLDLAGQGRRFVERLCAVRPNRRTGSAGNRQATAFIAETLAGLGYDTLALPFECLDYLRGPTSLTGRDGGYEVYTSPYSRGCELEADLAVASSFDDLDAERCQGRLLLLTGALCAEPLMPKGFVFYNPENHRRLIARLEQVRPAGIIAATGANPQQAGALNPFPLIADGEFDIPNVYCSEQIGRALARRRGRSLTLQIDARRIPSTAANVVARLNQGAPAKVVVSAHLDAYEDSPGATDNASGVSVLMLLGRLLSEFDGPLQIELVALNGEDHYSAAGQMDYLGRSREEFGTILLAVNVDGVGYCKGRSAFSFYNLAPERQAWARRVLGGVAGLIEGEPWFQGDHMLFVQSDVPAIAWTSELTDELLTRVTHTAGDTPDLIDGERLAEVARAIEALIRALSSARA